MCKECGCEAQNDAEETEDARDTTADEEREPEPLPEPA